MIERQKVYGQKVYEGPEGRELALIANLSAYFYSNPSSPCAVAGKFFDCRR
jgi:hypothetical protein